MRAVLSIGLLIAAGCAVGCSSSGDGASSGGGGSGTSASSGETATASASSGSGASTSSAASSSGSSGSSSSSGGGGNHTNPLSQTLIDEFVTAHNNARSGSLNPPPSPALPPVSWDYALADSAYNYLSKCQSSDGQLVDHNDNRTMDYAALGGKDYVGENIYASSATTGSSATPTAAVSAWMSEASMYDYATNSGNAGHYTQVVWRTSVRIGCAIVDCPSLKFRESILCDYAPGGNFNGQKPY